MNQVLIKPYEISIWEDVLTTSEGISYYKEKRIAVIGSDKMTSPNRAYNPVLTENVNGEVSFSFSMRYRYFDDEKNELVENSFIQYLVNERKVKLKYNDSWYDFVIKECDENSENYEFNYTAQGLFPLELAKVGYNLTFDTEIGGNQGTIIELAKQVVEPTDWVIDEEDCDTLRQLLKEPVYVGTVSTVGSANIINVDTNEPVTLVQGETVYLFYSQITEKTSQFLQFVRASDIPRDELGAIIRDSDNVVTATNCRIKSETIFNTSENVTTITSNGTVITLGALFDDYQINRVVYRQLTTYDPVMQKTVDVYDYTFSDVVDKVYHYTDYKYTSSDIVSNFITNGTDFGIIENEDSPQGWSAATKSSKTKDGLMIMPHLAVTTYPNITTPQNLVAISDLTEIENYIETKFDAVFNRSTGANTIVNTGIEDSASLIDHITAGERFVLRIRGGYSDRKHGEIKAFTVDGEGQIPVNRGVRAIVAKYTTTKKEFYADDGTRDFYYSYNIDIKKPLLDFTEAFVECNNIITGGSFDSAYGVYSIDDIPEIPSTKYCYIAEGSSTEYVWNPKQQKYVQKSASFLNYYMATATAKYSINNKALTDPETHIGVFLYTPDGDLAGKYLYINDVQLTRHYLDENGKVVTLGNAPTAMTTPIHQYYIKPGNNARPEEINLYETLEALADESALKVNNIVPVYNEKSEKILSISESQSNCFNILQSLCETFECWLKLKVKHDETGAIELDKDYRPIKRISFKEYTGDINYAGFKYGVNLNSINRNIDSSEFVTKLIVEPAQSEYNDDGSVTIQYAQNNPSGESYILDFNYYINKGLITNGEACRHDINTFNQQLKVYNDTLKDLEKEKIRIENALIVLDSKINVLDAMVLEAQDNYNRALSEFRELTKMSYSDYVAKAKANPESVQDFTKDENVIDIIGEIYTCVSVVNNYTGTLSNLKKEYKKLDLQCHGIKEYAISVSVEPATSPQELNTTEVVIDQYIEGFKFALGWTNHTVTPAIISQEEFTSGPNDRIFTVRDNSHTYDEFIIKAIPSQYQVEYFEGNQKRTTEVRGSAYFKIHDGSDAIITHKFILAPKPEYAEVLSIDEKIKKAREGKAEVEKAFYKKYSRFIQEGTWNSTDYIEHDMYYLDAVQVGRVSAQPKVSYEIKVTEISGLKDYESYNFKIGDQTWVEDRLFFGSYYTEKNGIIVNTPIKEHVIVSESEWHLDSPEDNVITVRNYKTQFEDLFQRISATVQTVQFNEATYPKTTSILGANGLIDRDLLLKSWNEGAAGYNLVSDGTIVTDSEGILIQDLTNATNCVKIINKGIKVSADGGRTWKNVIDGYGVNADALTAGTINTQQVWLMDGENPSFRWDKSGLSAFKAGETIVKYVPCTETEVISDVDYYNRIIEYDIIDYNSLEDLEQVNPKELQWYEYNAETNTYSLTSDETVNNSKTYYQKLITNDYEIIALVNPVIEGWYEYNAEHDIEQSSYVLTNDTVIKNKDYYLLLLVENNGEPNELTEVYKLIVVKDAATAASIDPNASEWYEYNEENETYILTLDTSILDNKNYYLKSKDTYHQIILPPLDNPAEEGWYKQEVTTNNTYDLKTYVRFDRHGLYGIQNDENYVATSLDDVKEKASFGLTWDGFFIKNSYTDGYVSISSDDDFQVVSTNVTKDYIIEGQTIQTIVVAAAETPEIVPCEEEDTSVVPGLIYYTLELNSETLEYEYRVVTPTENDNPYELGWYKSVLPKREATLPRADAIVTSITDDEGTVITNYTVQNGIITINDDTLNELIVSYILPANVIDLGGQGILQVNSVELNGEDYTNYSYDKSTGILSFAEELKPDDRVVVNYRLEHIKIGALDFDDGGAPSKYGISVKNLLGETVFETNDEGNLTVTGTINATDGVFNGTVYATDGEFTGHVRATSGEFIGDVRVGADNQIVIDGGQGNPIIATSNYLANDQEGWCINGTGDAVFNNVNVRGAIRTTVFEKDTIQTVGGAFLFRPSILIEKAEIRMEGNRPDLVVTIQGNNPFAVGDWCQLGDLGVKGDIVAAGLTAVYEVGEITNNQIVLINGGEYFI